MIGYINGSPKTAKSNSECILEGIRPMLKEKSLSVSSLSLGEESFRALCRCDKIILVFPLYVDALPSHLLRFLMEFQEYRTRNQEKAIPFYAAAQCGFPEGVQNRYALDILSHYCPRANFIWSGGIGLGGAGLLAGGPESAKKPLKKLLSRFAQAIDAGKTLPEKEYANAGMPRWMYLFFGNMGWTHQGKANGYTKKQLYRMQKDSRLPF